MGLVGGGRECGGARAAGGGVARGAALAAAPGQDQGLIQGQYHEEPRASPHQHQHQQLPRQSFGGDTPAQDPGRQQPWWDDLDDLLGSLGTGAHAGIQTPAGGRGSAGGSGGAGGGGGGAKRQAMLTADGRCVLPPPAAPGEAWRPAATPSHTLGPGQGVPAGAAKASGPSNGSISAGAGVGPKTQIALPYPALGPRGAGKGGAVSAGPLKVGGGEVAAAGKRGRGGSQGADTGFTDAGPAPGARSGVPGGTAAGAAAAAAGMKRPRHTPGGAAGGAFATANALSDPAIAGWGGPGSVGAAAVAAAASGTDAGAGKGGSKRKAAGAGGAAGGGSAALLSALLPLGEELDPGGEQQARATLACDPQVGC